MSFHAVSVLRRSALATCVVLSVAIVSTQTTETTRPGQTWDWSALGLLDYETLYTATLPISNSCKVPVTVAIASQVPALTHRREVTLLPGQSYEVPFLLLTPPRPALSMPPPDRSNATHQACVRLRGVVAITSAGISGGVECPPLSSTIEVVGHVHWRQAEPSAAKTARSNLCARWWNTGQRPPDAADLEARCTDTIRAFASALRERVLDAPARLDPPSWAWLPSVAQIQTMTVEQLVAMRVRAMRAARSK